MTVDELIEKLTTMRDSGQCSGRHKVVISQYSEYTEMDFVEIKEVFNNGGYYSRPYRPEDKARAHGAVYLGG